MIRRLALVPVFALLISFSGGCGQTPQPDQAGAAVASAVQEPREIWEITWRGFDGIEHIKATRVSVSTGYLWYIDLETGKTGYIVSPEIKIVQKK